VGASAPASASAPVSAPASAPAISAPPARWDGATPVTFARPTSLCKGKRLGSWVRLDCADEHWVFGFSLLGGSSEGVELHGKPKQGAFAIFPVRPGDRRLFVIHRLSASSGYAVDEQVEVVISETWIDGEPDPTITVD
jgi:hypothetical protein